MDRDALLERLVAQARKAPPEAASHRVAEALHCPVCGTPTRLIDWFQTQAVFACPSCGAVKAVEIGLSTGGLDQAG